MTRFFIALLMPLIVLSLLPGSSVAKERKVAPYTQEQYDRRANEMTRLDANKDGFLQKQELQGHIASKFNAVDLDADGVLSKDEIAKSLALTKEAHKETQVDRVTNRLKIRYKNADENKDGKITQQEYNNSIGERLAGFDSNNDGVIDVTEYRTDEEKDRRIYRKGLGD